MDFDWITPKQAAEKWSISDRRIQYLCANGKINDILRVGRTWLIPKDALKPIDGRTKAAREEKAKNNDDK